ncbi:MAG: hypothetical protein K5764_06595 [Prevotella sp.]|nr:hypothetical protein [Prevotella sp.]
MMKKLFWSLTMFLSCGLALVSCVDNMDNPSTVTPSGSVSDVATEPSAYSEMRDVKVAPGDNFFLHCTGAWMASNPYGISETSGAVMDLLDAGEKYPYQTAKTNHPVINQLAADWKKRNFEGDAASFMKVINGIMDLKTSEDLWKCMGQLVGAGYKMPFDVVVMDLNKTVSGLLGVGSDTTNVAPVLTSIGIDKETANDISDLGITWTKEINKNSAKIMGITASDIPLRSLTLPTMEMLADSRYHYRPTLLNGGDRRRAPKASDPLGIMLTAAGITDFSRLAVVTPELEEGLYKVSTMLTPVMLKGLIIYYLAVTDEVLLSKYADFNSTAASLAKEDNPLAGLMNKTFVAEKCKLEYREETEKMADEFRAVFNERIAKNSWLEESTKVKFQQKLALMDFFIGWPDDEKAFFIPTVPTAGNFYEDVQQIRKEYKQHLFTMMGKKDKGTRWALMCSKNNLFQGNAFYVPFSNMFYIYPSNFLYPIVDRNLPRSHFYAGLGAGTIGHEMTHGFDSSGANFDGYGNEAHFFTAVDLARFKALQQKMIDRYNNLILAGTVYIDGKNTLAENIADYGGLCIGFDVWMRYVDKVLGVTGAERERQAREFFRAYAWAWNCNFDDAMLLSVHLKDNHSPNHARVNGPVSMADVWYDLFGVTPNNKLYVVPADRANIW